MLQVSEKEFGQMIGFAKYSSGANGIANMIRLARSEPGVPISPDQLDRDQFLLNVANGTIDLRTGDLRPARQADYITKLSPVALDPAAACPTWKAFLSTVLGGDPELETFVKRFCGYCLTGSIVEQILVILWGSGANGKTTFLNVLLDLLGDYGLKTTEGLLREKRGESHPTEIASLCGRRLAIASETSDSMKLSETRVKELTGSERLSARRMREDFWEFNPTHKLLVATNFRPEISGTDHAIWRRIRLVPFDVTIAKADQDKLLPEKLKAEYSGILRWMVDGCLEWQREGLNVATAIETATAGYRAGEDVLGDFIATCCREGSNATIGAATLIDAYKVFTGDKAMTAKRFGTLLAARGYSKERFTAGASKGKACWRGLEIASGDG